MLTSPNGFGLYSLRPTGAWGGYVQWLRGEKTWAEIQARSPLAGIYQRTRKGEGAKWYVRRYFKPGNPQTVPQQARRAVFRNGVVHWHALTPDERYMYNEKARNFRMSGFNLHQREWLAAH